MNLIYYSRSVISILVNSVTLKSSRGLKTNCTVVFLEIENKNNCPEIPKKMRKPDSPVSQNATPDE